jgi:hypothetical protein
LLERDAGEICTTRRKNCVKYVDETALRHSPPNRIGYMLLLS